MPFDASFGIYGGLLEEDGAQANINEAKVTDGLLNQLDHHAFIHTRIDASFALAGVGKFVFLIKAKMQ